MAKKTINDLTVFVTLGDIKSKKRAMKAVEENASNHIQQAWEEYIDEHTKDYLGELPIERLSVIGKGIPVTALQEAGFKSLGEISESSTNVLESIPGIGEFSARKIRQAVQIIHTAAREEAKPQLNPDHLTDKGYEVIRSLVQANRLESYLIEYAEILEKVEPILEENRKIIQNKGGKIKWLFTSKVKKAEITAAEEKLEEVLSSKEMERLDKVYTNALKNIDTKEILAKEFTERNIEFYTTLEKITGFGKTDNLFNLSDELAQSIEEFPIAIDFLHASLRGYQEFGAKYILHQKKVLLGDEMGLGKTIQALAAIIHLYQNGKKSSVVICPLSVLTNWQREIKKFIDISTFIFYGRERESEFEKWVQEKGVLLTTFEQTKKLSGKDIPSIDICIVDEAHYVKNPNAQRSKAVYNVAAEAEHLVFMSGTPLENNIEEMKQLIFVLQPDIAAEINPNTYLLQPNQFKKLVAPVYLRRNREDVLVELPEMEAFERWVDFGKEEANIYKEFVEIGHIMGMRRAAWMGRTVKKSPKLAALMEICEEAKANGYKVLIFSYFRDVIRIIEKALGERAFEPISGDVSNARRQQIIDDFTQAEPGAVLISQITAGGVGLNIQAANVVILCEPQWKPSIEQQAISRAYRMGQIRNVLVYRILTNKSVDEGILELLGYKTRIFDEYARESDMANQSKLAKDITDKEMRKKLISKERERLQVATDLPIMDEKRAEKEEVRVLVETK